MISSRAELQFFIKKDREANLGLHVSEIKYWMLLLYGADRAKTFRLLKSLRKYEWSATQRMNHSSNILYAIIWLYRKLKYNRLCSKYNIVIKPNVVGYGLYLPHIIGGDYN